MGIVNLLTSIVISGLSALPSINFDYGISAYNWVDLNSVNDIVALGSYSFKSYTSPEVVFTYNLAPNDYTNATCSINLYYDFTISVFFRGNSFTPTFGYSDFLYRIDYGKLYCEVPFCSANDGTYHTFLDKSVISSVDNPYVSDYGTFDIGAFVDGRLCDIDTLKLLLSYNFCVSNSLASPYFLYFKSHAFDFTNFNTICYYGASDFTKINFAYNDNFYDDNIINYSFNDTIIIDDLNRPLYQILDMYQYGISNTQDSYESGYNTGYEYGFSLGDSNGYARGFDDGFNADSVALTVFSGILSVGLIPIDFFLSIFNFEILGINLTTFITSMLTLMIVIIMLRVIFNGGSNG